MVHKNDVESAPEKNETLCKYLIGNKISHRYDADSCEHLSAGDKVHLTRIPAGPKTYWYGGAVEIDGARHLDKEALWDFLSKKYKIQEK